MKILITIGLFLLCWRGVAQNGQSTNYADLDSVHKAKLDSLIFSRIPYSADKAKQDITNGNIQIIELTSVGSPSYSPDEIESVEQRFGFHFAYDFLKYPTHHLEQAETEYNKVMYQYLDSINNTNCEKAIWSELARMYYERQVYANKTDEELSKTIRKKLRGESKEVKVQIFEADKLYRDRKFTEALKKYERISLETIKPETKAYLVNSQYHCLTNLQRYTEADSLKKMNNKIRIIK